MAEGDYKVGYSRPPKHSQFKKGRSGNPKGRPKTVKRGAGEVVEILGKNVKVKIRNKELTMQPFEASFRRLAQKALGGNVPAIKKFIKYCEEYGVIPRPPVDAGSCIIRAPKGVNFHEWFLSVTEEIPGDDAK